MTVDDPLIGKTIAGRYVVERRIGQGGMGAVYAGRQEPLGRPVAIKVLLSGLTADLQAAERFQVEATAVARLNHRGIVTVYDYGKTDDGTLFLAMELVDGTSLRRHLDEKKRLPWPEALAIAQQTAAALAVAHDKGIVHRDLKPDNLMLIGANSGSSGGRDVVVKVLDFGLAKMVEGDGKLTQRSVIMGTPGYMSPEQIHGLPVDSRCDLYALGVIFWEMVVGRAPIVDDTPIKILMRHLSEEIPAPTFVAKDAGLPRAADEIVLRLLQKDREHRPRSTSALAEVLDKLAAEPWAAPTALAMAPAAGRFDVDDWDMTFSVLTDGKGRPAVRAPTAPAPKPETPPPPTTTKPPPQTLLLQQIVEEPPPPAAAPPSPPPPPSAPPSAPAPPPAAAPAPPVVAAAPPAPAPLPPLSTPATMPAPPLPTSASNPFAPPPPAPTANRFGPPPVTAQPSLTVEREKPKTQVTAPKAPTTPSKPASPPMSPRLMAFLGILGVLVVVAVVDFVARGGSGAVLGDAKQGVDVNADDDALAIAARELQGTRLAIDAGLERARLTVETRPSSAARARLAELLAEKALLEGDFDATTAAEARALLPSVPARSKAALLLALGERGEAEALLAVDTDDRRAQMLLAEVVAERDPALALRLLDKPYGALGTRPLRARGRALLASGDADAAIAALDQRLAAVVDDATARALRARARFENGEDAAARADVDAALAKSANAREALALKVQWTTTAKEPDALLPQLEAAEQRHPELIAARLDALRRARRSAALPKVIAAAKDSADVDVVLARARALAFVGDVTGAHDAVAVVDATTLPPAQRSTALALSLSTSTPPSPVTALAFAQARPSSSIAALARAIADNKDPAAALPLLIARPPPAPDDDEARVLAALSSTEPFTSVLLTKLRTPKSAVVAQWAQKKPQDPRALLLLAQTALEQEDTKTARLRLQRVEAMKDLSDDVVRALQLLFARVEAHDGNRDAALARLSGQPQDAATLLVSSSVQARLGDAAGAKSRLQRLRALDGVDRDVVRSLHALP